MLLQEVGVEHVVLNAELKVKYTDNDGKNTGVANDNNRKSNKTNINLLVTRCINKFNIQQLYVLPTLYLCIV
jgi:hypothetical protein